MTPAATGADDSTGLMVTAQRNDKHIIVLGRELSGYTSATGEFRNQISSHGNHAPEMKLIK